MPQDESNQSTTPVVGMQPRTYDALTELARRAFETRSEVVDRLVMDEVVRTGLGKLTSIRKPTQGWRS